VEERLFWRCIPARKKKAPHDHHSYSFWDREQTAKGAAVALLTKEKTAPGPEYFKKAVQAGVAVVVGRGEMLVVQRPRAWGGALERLPVGEKESRMWFEKKRTNRNAQIADAECEVLPPKSGNFPGASCPVCLQHERQKAKVNARRERSQHGSVIYINLRFLVCKGKSPPHET